MMNELTGLWIRQIMIDEQVRSTMIPTIAVQIGLSMESTWALDVLSDFLLLFCANFLGCINMRNTILVLHWQAEQFVAQLPQFLFVLLVVNVCSISSGVHSIVGWQR